MTGSNAEWNEVIDLLDRLNGRSMKYLGIVWENNLMSAGQHSQLMEKVSKVRVKKFVCIMNDNFIKYEKETRWLLPKNCEVMYLEYVNNFMEKVLSNLSISIGNYQLK